MVSGSYDVNNDSDRLRSGVTCSFSLGCVWRNIDCCPLWGMLVTSLFMIYDLCGILSTLKLLSSYFQFPCKLVSVSCWFRRQVWTEPGAWLGLALVVTTGLGPWSHWALAPDILLAATAAAQESRHGPLSRHSHPLPAPIWRCWNRWGEPNVIVTGFLARHLQ